MGFGKVLGRSILKALKQTGITLGVVAATAVGTTMMDPTIMAPIWEATGVLAPVFLFLLSTGGQALVDLVKHRDKINPPKMKERSTYRRPE